MRGIRIATAIVVAAVIGLSFVSSARADDDYKIKIDRPMNVGDSFNVATTLTAKTSQTSDHPGDGKTGADGKKQDFTCVLQGVETVQEVTEKTKQSRKYSFKVAKCTKDGKEIIPAGTTVIAENVDGKTQVTIDGNEPDKDLKPVLSDLFDTTDPDDAGSDEALGTDVRQKVGGTWKMNADVVSKEFEKDDIPLAASELKGGGKLEEVSKIDGQPVEKIGMTIDGGFDTKTYPGNVTVTDCKLHIEETITVPVDVTTVAATITMKGTFTMKVATPKGKSEVHVDRTRETTISPVK